MDFDERHPHYIVMCCDKIYGPFHSKKQAKKYGEFYCDPNVWNVKKINFISEHFI